MKTNDYITVSEPLTWPNGWDRKHCTKSSRFGWWCIPVSIAKAMRLILDQFRIMGVDEDSVIVSTNLRLRKDGLPMSNQREPADSGASVWWRDGTGQKVIALDQYDRVADNLYAIAKTLEVLRGIERWGGGEILNRMFTGFAALTDWSNDWRSILGDAGTPAELERLFKKRRSEAHPDNGGSVEAFNRVMKAYREGLDEFKTFG